MARKKNATEDENQQQHPHQHQQYETNSNSGGGGRRSGQHQHRTQRLRSGNPAGNSTSADSYLEDDFNYPTFLEQLKQLGLEIRDIPGDGNCLFRALADQLEGSDVHHLKHRADACQYMLAHKEDFAPFVDDSTSFEDYVRELARPGTYAGNDALVAFARLHKLNIVIHQLDSNPWQIGGDLAAAGAPQLHLAYHNGEHYSSIRRLGDRTPSPSNITLKFDQLGVDKADKISADLHHATGGGLQTLVAQVAGQTGCSDTALIVESLREFHFDMDETVAYVCQVLESASDSPQTQPPPPPPLSSSSSSVDPSTESGSQHRRIHPHLHALSRKELKQIKKDRATERHRLSAAKAGVSAPSGARGGGSGAPEPDYCNGSGGSGGGAAIKASVPLVQL